MKLADFMNLILANFDIGQKQSLSHATSHDLELIILHCRWFIHAHKSVMAHFVVEFDQNQIGHNKLKPNWWLMCWNVVQTEQNVKWLRFLPATFAHGINHFQSVCISHAILGTYSTHICITFLILILFFFSFTCSFLKIECIHPLLGLFKCHITDFTISQLQMLLLNAHAKSPSKS